MTERCPSEAVLEAYELGETIDQKQRDHVRACALCEAKLKERRSAFDALGEVAIVRAIHRAVPAQETAPAKTRWLPKLIGVLSCAAAASVAFFVLRPPQPEIVVRTKGTVGFDVLVERNGVVRRAVPNEELRAGDHLRFEVDLTEEAHVMIVGVEANGALYNAFPATTSVAVSREMAKGQDQVLPGAVELDETLGKESLYLVSCQHVFYSSDVHLENGNLVVGSGCNAMPFSLKKVPR